MTVTLNQLTQEYGATVYTNLQTQNPSPTGINTKMTQSPKPRVKKIKSRLVGKKVSLKPVQRARELEEAIADIGFTLNLGRGVDLPEVGIDIKTRDVDAVSPHTVASMTADSIVATPYRYSNVFDKIQKQHRIKTQNGVVVDEFTYDFSAPYIQEWIESAYEAARAQMITGARGSYIPGNEYGYFEQSTTSENTYSFRMSDSAMTRIERIARSTYSDLFTEN